MRDRVRLAVLLSREVREQKVTRTLRLSGARHAIFVDLRWRRGRRRNGARVAPGILRGVPRTISRRTHAAQRRRDAGSARCAPRSRASRRRPRPTRPPRRSALSASSPPSRLANALYPKRIERRQRLRQRQLEHRQIRRPRQRVVAERRRHQLSLTRGRTPSPRIAPGRSPGRCRRAAGRQGSADSAPARSRPPPCTALRARGPCRGRSRRRRGACRKETSCPVGEKKRVLSRPASSPSGRRGHRRRARRSPSPLSTCPARRCTWTLPLSSIEVLDAGFECLGGDAQHLVADGVRGIEHRAAAECRRAAAHRPHACGNNRRVVEQHRQYRTSAPGAVPTRSARKSSYAPGRAGDEPLSTVTVPLDSTRTVALSQGPKPQISR